jgi:hypothetical protein
MQQLVHHAKVETVCEIGFNAGHSTLLWLASGAKRVLSFELGQYTYSTKAVSFLNMRYPGRFQVVMGDSLDTVPAFRAMWPDERCNLLFIDGGHYYRHAMGDLQNFRGMRNETFHLLVMDDTNQDEVAAAWKEYMERGYALENEVVWSDYSDHLIWFDRGSPQEYVARDPAKTIPEWRSSMSWGMYIGSPF